MLNAKNADKHVLYEHSVQSPHEEVDFIRRVFKTRYKREPMRLREDFCGSAVLAKTFVASDKKRTATGVDLDPKVLAWGDKTHRLQLDAAGQKRLTLHEGDVREALPARFDVVVAYNYSWWVFKQWRELVHYFSAARKSLATEGMFFLDIFGGSASEQLSLETRKYKGFTYIWEQAYYNPIDAHFQAHIHFEFKDGSRLKRAFSYDWRMWRMPEAREALLEAGFSAVDVYWEDTDTKGYPNGNFRVRREVGSAPSFNAYIVART